jgi:GAF domain-containing protein
MMPLPTLPDCHETSDDPVAETLRDRARLQEITDLALTSPGVDAILRATAQEAAERLGMPIALVTVVLDEAQHFAAMHGVEGWMARTRGTPVEWSFCRYAVAWREAFVVEDAAQHPLVHDNPLVEHDGVRAYAGHPLVTSAGHAVGALCVLGTAPRTFSAEDLDALRAFAAQAVARIEGRRAAAGV